jgi:hypothetical protein
MSMSVTEKSSPTGSPTMRSHASPFIASFLVSRLIGDYE